MKKSHPVLSCKEASVWERRLLDGSEGLQQAALQRAGNALGRAILQDMEIIGGLRDGANILILAGKGHNAADALIALREICCYVEPGKVDIVFSSDINLLKPLTAEALHALECPINCIEPSGQCFELANHYDLCIEGLLGMAYTPPLRDPFPQLLEMVNRHPDIRFRAAVDLPAGLTETPSGDVFRADTTYLCAIPKLPLFLAHAAPFRGRLHYLDIGFFDHAEVPASDRKLLLPTILAPLTRLRCSTSDKRSYGHLCVLAGSMSMPGALLMSLQAALLSGVGLLTAIVPEPLVGALAAAVPEVMWLPVPLLQSGVLDYAAVQPKIDALLAKSSALLCGPGLGDAPETHSFIARCVASADLPLVLDASALQPAVTEALLQRSPDFSMVLLTPHVGEFRRISGSTSEELPVLKAYAREHRCCLLLKGPLTSLTDGEQFAYSVFGGPVLARGGSGDILAGLCGGLYAQQTGKPFETLCQAAVWHGLAAQSLAGDMGERVTRTTDLLRVLSHPLQGVR
ncbi:MAG: NAD(P)H-hydrate dehydratase [Opitutales bacterium]|nr:NAD(P)H-hydrate dehydratase [Opitutales bacterium]